MSRKISEITKKRKTLDTVINVCYTVFTFKRNEKGELYYETQKNHLLALDRVNGVFADYRRLLR